MTSAELTRQVRDYMREQGRKRMLDADPQEIGKRGGRPPKPTYCSQCATLCESAKLAAAHCRRKRPAAEVTA